MSKYKQAKAADFREMTTDELIAKSEEFRRELFIAKSHRKDPKVDNPYRRHSLKRDVARIETVLNEKTRMQAKAGE